MKKHDSNLPIKCISKESDTVIYIFYALNTISDVLFRLLIVDNIWESSKIYLNMTFQHNKVVSGTQKYYKRGDIWKRISQDGNKAYVMTRLNIRLTFPCFIWESRG